MSWREAAYARGLLRRWRPPAPCISVGNIRWGGTGKTPLCLWLLHWAQSRNLKCALLTRGYKARPPSRPYLVRPDSSPVHAGDEPLLMAQAAPQARIVVDSQRTRSGPWIWEQWQPDLFLLDDGFQHLPVVRDLDLLLLLPSDLHQDWDRAIPSGPWREGRGALARASALLIKADTRERESLGSLVRSRLAPLEKPLFFFSPQACALSELRSNRHTRTIEHPYLLVSGVARPSSVEQTATAHLSVPPVKHMAFADHHLFTHRDILKIVRKAASMNLRDVICTAKDAVKIKPLLDQDAVLQDTALRWWRLDMEVAFDHLADGHENFAKWLAKWWEKSQHVHGIQVQADPQGG